MRWFLLIAVLICAPIVQGEEDSKSLADALRAVLEKPEYKHAHWGLRFVDQRSGEVIYEHNSEQLFAPASTTKLFSVASALATLGADYRFQTPVVRAGEIKEGVLQGDLILIASGDLSFGGRTNAKGEIEFTNSDHTYANDNTEGELTPADPLAGLNDLAQQVAAAGIQRVKGDVLIDDRLFEKAESTGSGPSRLTPMMINDNLIDITIEPTSPGKLAKISWRPQTAQIQIENKIETGEANTPLETWIRDYGNGKIVLTGKIPKDRKPLLRIYEVENANRFARYLFLEALTRAGVRVDAPLAHSTGNLPAREVVQRLPQVALHTSPPFSQSARLILKVSHNLQASTLPLLVAAKQGKFNLSEGMRQQREVLKTLQVPVDSISFGGGAGGSRADYVTPHATTDLLLHMATRDDFTSYRDALPSFGIDGTLSKVVAANSPARGKIFAKTGTFYWDNAMNGYPLLTSKALAGYMTTATDRPLCFALFVNHVHLREGVTASSVGKDLGRICEIVFEHE